MGLLDSIWPIFGFRKQHRNLLLVGLDNAGKSTILKFLENDKSSTLPTIGVSIGKFTHKKASYTVFDMAGHGNYRDLWQHYYSDVHAILVVIDSTDTERLAIVKDELANILNDPMLNKRVVPIGFVLNKMDLGGISVSECTLGLGLDQIHDKKWSLLYNYFI
jgi:ADP-ribosylation factor-like protein 6